jgi:hypothetical protein
VTDETKLQVTRKDGESSLTLSKARSGLITRGRRDAEALLTTRTIELSDTDEEGHFGFKLQWRGTQLWFLAGTREIQLDVEDARKLAAFLVKGCADLVWDSPTPILVGQQWCLYAARDISLEYPRARARDVPRRRVRVHCGNYKWHLLPFELDRLGMLFREALR